MKFYTPQEIQDDIFNFEKQVILLDPVNIYEPGRQIVFICKYSEYFKENKFDPIEIEIFIEAIDEFVNNCTMPFVNDVPELTKTYRVFGYDEKENEHKFTFETDHLYEVKTHCDSDEAVLKYQSFIIVDMEQKKVSYINHTLQ